MKKFRNIWISNIFLVVTMLWCNLSFGEIKKSTAPNSISCQGDEQTCRQSMNTALKESMAIWNKLGLKSYKCKAKTLVSFEDLHSPRVKFATAAVKNGKITKIVYFDQNSRPIKPLKQDRIPSVHTIDDLYKICQNEFFKEFEPIDQYMGYVTFNTEGILEACGYVNQSDLSESYDCVIIKD